MLAASERGGLLHAPDIYMQKLVVGAQSKNSVNLDAPVSHNLKQIARCLDRDVEDLVVVVLDRKRHEPLIAEIRDAGARIRLIGDGDLTAAIGGGGGRQRHPCGDGQRRGARGGCWRRPRCAVSAARSSPV